MAVIKVHGSALSSSTQRALVCLYEKELDFEFVPVDMPAGAHKQTPFISLNTSTLAITKYIAEEYAEKGTQLVLPDSKKKKKKAIASVWMEVEAHQFSPVTSKLGWEIIFKPMFGMTTDRAVVEENEAKLGKVLDVYENRLSESKYLGGDCFSLVDLHHIPSVQYMLETTLRKLFESRPHVNAWVADIIARPAWAKVLAMKG